jgi:hypothetical protein
MTRAARRFSSLSACIAVMTMVAASGAWAQSVPADRDRVPRSETEGQAPPPASGNASDQLDRQKGVLQPPRGVDPEMQVPPPAGAGRTPVIPPPGSPGGDQSVQPK